MLVVGCATVKDYYPVTVGSTWTYFTWVTIDSSPTTHDTVETHTRTVRAVRSVNLTGGGTAIEILTRDSTLLRPGLAPRETTFVVQYTTFVVDADTVVLSYDSLSDPAPDTLLRLPFVVGRAWRGAFTDYVVAGRENISPAIGEFRQCWRLLGTPLAFPEQTTHHWYANGVGLVESHLEYVWLSVWDVVAHTELTAYDVK